jgi:squalene-hopene/tetraprenyl-beta-curcumene cyclase
MGVAGGIRFLLAAQTAGAWRDFKTLAGTSDEWVTAYVATQLAHVERAETRAAADQALRWLLRRRFFSRGWGYNALVPADSDSTAWVLRLAAQLGSTRTRLRRARQFLETSAFEDGGMPTFARSGPIRRFTRLARKVSFAGWCAPHTCVTAAAAPVTPGVERARDYLRQTQAADGSWRSYWWVDTEYSTALALEALVNSGGTRDGESIARAAHWASHRLSSDGAVRTALHPDGSAFATALCVLALQSATTTASDEMLAARAWLLAAQTADGSWLPSAELRIPPPHERDPDRVSRWQRHGLGAGSILNDQNRLFTTATVVRALAREAA